MTSTQLYERLCARFTEQAAAAAVAEMVELDYVNDDRYAETRAHGLLMARKSRRAAAQNLRQKGLNSQQIEQALETVYAPDENGESPELEAAAALVASRYRKKQHCSAGGLPMRSSKRPSGGRKKSYRKRVLSPMKIACISLGCPKNQVDLDVMVHILLSAGHETVADLAEADVILVNTCGFIESAKTEAIENILEACAYKQQNPDLKVIETG